MVEIGVFNNLGQKVISERLNVATDKPFRQQLDLGKYSKGLYIIQISTKETTRSYKVIRQ